MEQRPDVLGNKQADGWAQRAVGGHKLDLVGVAAHLASLKAYRGLLTAVGKRLSQWPSAGELGRVD